MVGFFVESSHPGERDDLVILKFSTLFEERRYRVISLHQQLKIAKLAPTLHHFRAKEPSRPEKCVNSKNIWSREWELNPRPADFSADIMLLDSRALFLTIPHGFAWYLASFVQKLLTTSPTARLQ